jgi:NTE family protein
MVCNESQRPNIGLVLSGGGARGLAHIGVLKVLERAGLRVGCIAGSSMGGILAAAYAAGWSPTQLEAEALRMSRLRELIKLVDVWPHRRGVVGGQHLYKFLSRFVSPDVIFDDLEIPLGLMAVDLLYGEEVRLTKGSVLDAMRATCAFPGILPAVESNGHWLVDGGLLNNLPVELVRDLGADVVIAVDVSNDPTNWPPPEAPESLRLLPDFLWDSIRAINLLASAVTREKVQRAKPELLVHVPLPPEVGIFSSFNRAKEIIALGEFETNRHLAAFNALALDHMVNSTVS